MITATRRIPSPSTPSTSPSQPEIPTMVRWVYQSTPEMWEHQNIPFRRAVSMLETYEDILKDFLTPTLSEI